VIGACDKPHTQIDFDKDTLLKNVARTLAYPELRRQFICWSDKPSTNTCIHAGCTPFQLLYLENYKAE